MNITNGMSSIVLLHICNITKSLTALHWYSSSELLLIDLGSPLIDQAMIVQRADNYLSSG